MLSFLSTKIESDADVGRVSRVLWFIASITILTGLAVEVCFSFAGAIAASGGLAIAFTAPYFGSALSQMNRYSIWVAIKLFHFSKEHRLGEEFSDSVKDPNFTKAMQAAKEKKQEFEDLSDEVEAGNRSIVETQVWILALSSAIWATGQWVGSFLRCGEMTC